MKNMKKLVAALLVLTMVLALTSTAFAYKEKDADFTVKFTGSAWGYGKVTNNYGKSKSDVALRKGSIAQVVATKGDWYKIEIPARGLKGYDYFWFNKKYTKVVDLEVRLIYSSGGSGRAETDEDRETAIELKKNGKKYTKVTIAKKGRKENIRKAASLKGKVLGVLRYGKSLKLHKDYSKIRDDRGIDFYKVVYNGKAAWVSAQYAKLK